jgi:glucan 1,3-beta-glucosidase
MWNTNGVLKLATLLIFLVVLSFARSTPSKDVYIEHQGSWATRDTISVGHMKSKRQAADSVYWLDQMDHTGPAQGFAPFAPVENPHTYPVYRNVLSKSFGATGDGSTDDSDAIQRALDFDGQGGSRSDLTDRSLSTRPAQIFLPSGTYRISKTIHIPLNTIIVGDPRNRPVIKAASDITGSVINTTSHPGQGELEFFLAIKNIIIDTTALDKDREVTALHWATAQACQLTNLAIFMPTGSNSHVGINMEGGSSTTFSDVVSKS